MPIVGALTLFCRISICVLSSLFLSLVSFSRLDCTQCVRQSVIIRSFQEYIPKLRKRVSYALLDCYIQVPSTVGLVFAVVVLVFICSFPLTYSLFIYLPISVVRGWKQATRKATKQV